MKKFIACMLAGLAVLCVSGCNQKGKDSSSAGGGDSSQQQPEVVRTVTEAEWKKALSAESFLNVTLKETQTWSKERQRIDYMYIWEAGIYIKKFEDSEYGPMRDNGEQYMKIALAEEVESGPVSFIELPAYSLFVYNEDKGAYEYSNQGMSYTVFFENGVYVRQEYISGSAGIGRVEVEAYDYGKTQPVDIFENSRTIDEVLSAWGTYQAKYQGTNEILDETTLQELISLLRGVDTTTLTDYHRYNNDFWNWEYTFAVSGQFAGEAYTELKINWIERLDTNKYKLSVVFGDKTVVLETVS